jgi:hypothetical protein
VDPVQQLVAVPQKNIENKISDGGLVETRRVDPGVIFKMENGKSYITDKNGALHRICSKCKRGKK